MLLFEEIVPGIKLLKSPFSKLWSGIVLIRGHENILIDSGASTEVVDECLIPALRAEGLIPADIDWLLNTHCHGDHIGGHHRFRELCPVQVAAWRGALDKMRNPLKYNKLIRERFPGFSAPPSLGLRGVEPDLLLDDGALVAGRLRLVHAPGHDDDCLCWFDEKTKALISGDAVQANGTSGQGIGFYQDLIAYRQTLAGLRQRQAETLVAGHDFLPGGAVVHGREKVTAYLNKCFNLTEHYDILVKKIRSSGTTELDEIAVRLIRELGGEPPKFLFLAMYTTSEHIKERTDAQ